MAWGYRALEMVMKNKPTSSTPYCRELEHSAHERFAYRITDACAALGIGRTSLYKLVERNELRLIRIAGRSLVPRSEIERLTRVDEAA